MSQQSSLYSLRMPTAELHAMLEAARAAGEKASEYVRKAIRMRVAAGAPRLPQSACYVNLPANWTVVAVCSEPTHNTGCQLANVDWTRVV